MCSAPPRFESAYGKADVLIFVHGHNKPFEGRVCFNSSGRQSLIRLFIRVSVPLLHLRVEKCFSNEKLASLLTDWLMEYDEEGVEQRDVSLLLSPNPYNVKLWMDAGGPEPTLEAFVKWMVLHRLEVIQHIGTTNGRSGSLVVKGKTYNVGSSHLPPQTNMPLEFKCTEKGKKQHYCRHQVDVGKGKDEMTFYWDENGHKRAYMTQSSVEKTLAFASAQVTKYSFLN